MTAGDTFGLLECIETSLRFAPEDNSAGLYNKALALIKLGCYGDALPIIDELIERYPDDPRHLAERGSCALDMGYPQEALQYYQKAMEIWQRNPTVYTGICIYTGLCTAYMELGMKREGMEIALEGIKKFPDQDPMLYRNAGSTFYRMGWRNECIGRSRGRRAPAAPARPAAGLRRSPAAAAKTVLSASPAPQEPRLISRFDRAIAS